jgi:hypothetical protein
MEPDAFHRLAPSPGEGLSGSQLSTPAAEAPNEEGRLSDPLTDERIRSLGTVAV